MILFFYNLTLLMAIVLSAPWWLFRMATTHKYREGLLERLGFVRVGLARWLKSRAGRPLSKPLIWVHAVSVGEVLAISRLVAELDTVLPGSEVVISTTTRTGQALARERFGADRVFYCPLDLPWAVRVYLKALKPRMLVLAETEFWPNLLNGCFRRGIPVVVVNARISDRSWPRYWRLRGLWRPFLSQLAKVLAQSRTDGDRLNALGCKPERVFVSGNLKFDVLATQEAAATRLLKELAGGLRLLVAGSTLDGEEAALLAAWPELLKAGVGLAMVIAPRHPERFGTVAGLLERSGFQWHRRSELAADTVGLVSGEIVLLDSIGELASVYSLASVAFVGGSLVPAGGHNPLEPAQFGVPVVMGQHFSNFRAIVEALRVQEAIRIVTPGELASGLVGMLRDFEAAARMGKRGATVFAEQSGATERTMTVIRQILSGRGED
jgi:3-deoxy-D-manno-octulosonic-acid transferase